MRRKFLVHILLLVLCTLAACRPAAPGGQGTSSPQPAMAGSPQAAPDPALPTVTAGAGQERIPLRVFCAGSLILPFAGLEESFERSHPDVDVLNECHGSIQVIRHVTELHEKIDVVATADHALIPLLMYQALDPDSGQPYASWYIRFAGNRLALAYSPHSRYAGEITSENWHEIIRRPEVKLGLADPRFDASGYRALMALQLAEEVYQQYDILDGLIHDQFTLPVTAFAEAETTEISVPEVLEVRAGSNLVIRGASIQLIALLESGDLDYAFEYESVIRQHNLNWVALPEEINLGSAEHAGEYARVQVKLDFQRFASVKPVFSGEPIGYGITIPSNAPQSSLAEEFISFLLSPEGRAVMEANYQPVLDPPGCDQAGQVPPALSSICGPGEQP